jgi:hypothetical protein
MSIKEIEIQIASQCGPLLNGVKISNLLNISTRDNHYIEELFKGSDISYEKVYADERRSSYILYKKKDLLSYLNKEESRKLLKSLSYNSEDLSEIFRVFSKRYSDYMKKEGEFPHEMGIFLGYPIKDVIDFINNKGRNCLFTGYWKVYNNLNTALMIFETYNRARDEVLRMISDGRSIRNIIEAKK